MKKRFVKKLVSYLLVGALVIQDGVPAIAANDVTDNQEETTVSELDIGDTASDEEAGEETSADDKTLQESSADQETPSEPIQTEDAQSEESSVDRQTKESESEEPKESESEEQSTKDQETTEDNSSEEQTDEEESDTETTTSEETSETEESVEEETTTEKETEEVIKKAIKREIVDTEERIEEYQGYPGDKVIVDETNLLPEDLFAADENDANKLKYWEKWNGSVSEMEVGEDQKSITIKMNQTPTENKWDTGLKHKDNPNMGLEDKGSYQISYKITSTVDRTVTVDFDERGDADRREIELKANTETKIQYIETVGENAWTKFSFYLGEADYGAHDITISDFSIRKVTIQLEDGEEVAEDPDNLLTNGTFADGQLGSWTTNSVGATIKTSNNRVAFDITQSQAGWQVWLQQNFEWDSKTKYKITFDATSTIDRYIMAGADRAKWLPHKKLEAGKTTKVEYQVTGMTGNNFAIVLGSNLDAGSSYKDWDGNEIPASEAINQTLDPHRVIISNVSITKYKPEIPEFDPLEDGDPVEETPGNLLTNGTFAKGTEGWDEINETDFSTIENAKYKVGFIIADEVDDNKIGLKQNNIQWKEDYKYTITFDALSTIDRSIMVGADDGKWLAHKELEANKPTKIEYQVTGMTGSNFVIALGSNLRASNEYIDGDGNKVPASQEKKQKLDPHRIVISNVCITEKPDLEDGDEIDETPGNLLKNGTFASGVFIDNDKIDGWEIEKVNATVKTAKYKVAFDMTGEANADYLTWLKQAVELKPEKTYKIAFNIESTIDRYIIVGFDRVKWFPHEELKANTPKEVEYEVTDTTGGDFVIALGSNLREVGDEAERPQQLSAHRIIISNVRITEELADGTEVEENPNNLLKNGTFKDGNTKYWTISDTDAILKTAKYNIAFDITGNSADNEVSLKQNIEWDKDCQYKITFEAKSDVARSIMVKAGNTWLEHKALKAGESTKIEYKVTGISGNDFMIALGSNLRASSAYKDWDGNEISASAAKDQTLDPHRVIISNVCITDLEDGDPVTDILGNLIKNGTFADGTTKDWTVNDANATVKKAKYKVVFDMTGESGEDKTTGLQQKVELDPDKSYKIAFNIESSIDRDIIVGFDNANNAKWFPHQKLTAGKATEIVLDGVTEITGGNFMIALGSNLRAVDGGEANNQKLSAHRITISNVRITENPPEGLNFPELEDGKEVEENPNNLLKNGTFKNGSIEGWEYEITNAYPQTANYRVAFNIIKDSDGDQVCLKQEDIEWNEEDEYDITFEAISDVNRFIMVGAGNKWLEHKELKKGEITQIRYKVAGINGKGFVIALGSNLCASDVYQDWTGKDVASSEAKEQKLARSRVIISNVCVIKRERESSDLEDGDPVEETKGNLLTNGTFAEGTTEGWQINNTGATVKKARYRVAFDITENSADYMIWLRQDFDWDENIKYEITFDASSSVDRYIMAGADGGTWLQHKLLKANEKTTVKYQVTGMKGNNFVIALGSNLRASSAYKDWDGKEIPAGQERNQTLDPHRVIISNVCITELPPELPGDTENDKPFAAITSLDNYYGYTPADLVPLKDGKFTQFVKIKAGDKVITDPPKAVWSLWHEGWMTQWNDEAVSCKPVKDGVAIYIETTGGGSGNKPWDVQLSQPISLARDTKYVLSFKVTSEKARMINISIDDIDNGKAWIKPIAIQKDEPREVVLNLPVLAEDAKNKTFQIQMGNVSGDVKNNTLTFTDMKLEVNGYSEMAEKITDGYFDDGELGSFTITGSQKDVVSYRDNYIKAEIKSACDEGDIVVSSGRFDLLGEKKRSLYKYVVSFVAGAMENMTARAMRRDIEGGRTIKAVLEDASGNVIAEQTFEIKEEAQKYSFTYAPEEPKKDVVLKLLLGGNEGTVCLDTVRCDLEGYPEAAGLDAEGHDITILEKKEAPVISEMPADQAIAGKDIVISFDKAGNEKYKEAIDGVYINGSEVAYTIGERTNKGGNNEYTITLDQSLFAVTGQRQTFTIEVCAPWYLNNRIRQTVYTNSPWTSTWLEEFDGSALDMSKWSYQIGTGDNNDGWGNNEQQCYTNSPNNLAVENGELIITARKERNDSGRPYTSARIWTMQDDGKTAKFSQTYGRMEAKMKLAGGEGYQGVWPAFWMLPVDLHYGAWPLSGEIDILEARGREPELADGTVHYGKPWPNNESHGDVFDYSKSQYNSDSDINDYHVYAVEWEPGEIRWYVDDELYFTYSNWYSQSSDNPDKFRYPAPFDQDFYIILNLAIGGTFDNNLIPNDDKLPVDMKVDYVRVYQSKNGYKEVEKEPPVIKDESTDINSVKSELMDIAFAGINIITTDDAAFKRDAWNLVTLPSFYGSADFETITENGNVYAKITPQNLGIAAHAIQLIQHLDLVKGYNYRISYDAWTEGSRKLNMKIGQDGTEGWNTYQTFETSLTSSPQHYKYEFQSGVTDRHSRVEFNLATNSQPVYIGNIKYEIIDEIITDPDTEKTPSDNGNCVYNGSFNVGAINGLSYWHMDNSDGKTLRENKDYVFTATKGNLYQYGLQLLQDDSYKLTFSADAADGRKITVILSDKEGKTVYTQKDFTLTASRDNYEMIFTMPKGVTDTDAKLCFEFGEGSSPVKITNIWLQRTTYNNIEWDEVNSHPLLNGDFELGNLYWSDYNAGFEVVVDPDNSENHYAKVNAPKGGNKWDALLSYDGLAFTAKTDYEFSFDVRATRDNENIRVTMEDGNYTAHYEQKELEVGTEWRSYTFDVRFTDNKEGLALKFQVGGANEQHEVYFDNVVIRAKGAPKEPGIITAESYYRQGSDIVLSYIGEEDWVKNAVVYLDDVQVRDRYVTFKNGKLTLDESLFADASALEPKTYTLVVRAEGYGTSRSVAVVVYPIDGNRIINGNFTLGENGLDYWGNYILTEGRDYVTSENGAAKIHYGGPAYDGSGNLVSWGIQLFQDKILVESGKKFQLSFYAHATVNRWIQVMYNQGKEISEYIKITTEPTLYEIEIDSTSDLLKLQFLLSTVGANGGAMTGADILPTHNIYIDNVCLLEMTNDRVPVYKDNLEKLLEEYKTIQEEKDKYSEESYKNFEAAYEAAQAILDNRKAKQAEVNRAEDQLREAKEKLDRLVDKKELAELIKACEALKEKDYTKSSWKAFAKALGEAKKYFDSLGPDEVKEVYNDLAEARDALELADPVNKTKLEELIKECESLNEDDYTEESWNSWKKQAGVLDEAKKVFEDEDATQDKVYDAYDALEDAVSVLELKPTDKTELDDLIAEYEELNLNADDYTKESWNAYQEALTKAKEVSENAEATQEEVNEACNALKEAKKALVKLGDKSELDALINENLDESEYTAESWKKYAEALTKAKEVSENAEATQEEVNEACNALKEAKKALVKLGDKSELDTLINENLDESRYTEESWKKYAEALKNAEAVSKKAEATQEEVGEACNALKAAKEALVVKPADKEELQELVNESESLKEIQFTSDSWGKYASALQQAQSVLMKEDATPEQVDEAYQILKEAQETLKANIEGLKALILECEDLSKDDYTEESWKKFEEALETAKDVSNDDKSTLDEVNDAYQKLKEAQKALRVNDSALRALMEEYGALNGDDYIEENWSPFAKALEGAKAVLDKTDATSDEVNKAYKALQKAKGTLDAAVNKTKETLCSLIDENEKLEEGDYTKESWTAFAKALTEAKEVSKNEEATQKKVDEACKALEAAKEALAVKPPVEKTDLNKLIEDCESLTENDYTAESWKNFAEALNKAKEVSEDAEATQEEVDEACKALKEAKEALKPEESKPADKSKLDNLIKESENLKESAYTKESWKNFAEALTKAQDVSKKAEVTQEEVDEACKALEAAKKALKPEESKPADEPKPADKSKLDELIKECEKVSEQGQGNSSDEIWKAFQDALTYAKGIQSKSDATQAEVNTAIENLQKAYDANSSNTHEHVYGEEWHTDSENHWKECSVCKEQAELAKHSFGKWIVEKMPSTSRAGSKYCECSVCGYRKTGTIKPLVPANESDSSSSDSGSYSSGSNNGSSGSSGSNSNTAVSKTNDVAVENIPVEEIVLQEGYTILQVNVSQNKLLKSELLNKYFGQYKSFNIIFGSNFGLTVDGANASSLSSDLEIRYTLTPDLVLTPDFDVIHCIPNMIKDLGFDAIFNFHLGNTYIGKKAYIYLLNANGSGYDLVGTTQVNEIGNVAIISERVTDVIVFAER